MVNKIYEPGEAKEIKKRIESISLINKNKKANARRGADDLKVDIEIEQLLNHSDKLYYEELLSD